MPTSWVVALAGPDQPFAIPLAAALGVPLYVNAETFFPISGALLDKGVGIGAVMALVITSMGVSVPEVALLGSMFRWRLVAAVLYIGGGFMLTFLVNVPMNQELALVSSEAAPATFAQIRAEYEGPWNFWNGARTVFSSLAFLALIGACLSRSKTGSRYPGQPHR